MKVLVIGGGAIEHAIVWRLSQSRHVNKIYCCPGNAGIAEIAECIDVSPNNLSAFVDFVKYEWIDLTIVGTEGLFLKGIVDVFEKQGCRVLGLDKKAAQLVSNRAFLKNLMRFHRIPTAEYKVFTSYLHAEDYVRLKGAPIVIKTNSTSEERGIIVASTVEEAIDTLRLIMKDRLFGEAGKQVIIEEVLNGEKISFIILTDEKSVIPFAGLYKYQRLFDGDKGPNTRGMGAFSPSGVITKELSTAIMVKIMKPIIKALKAEGIKYKGFLSADLIINKNKPYVLEFSGYLGDPETQTILPSLKTDFAEVALAITEEKLSDIDIRWKQETAVCIVSSSKGYPDKYQKGFVVTGLEKIKTMKDVIVFHDGTTFKGDDIVTSGGRVVSVTATGDDIKDASNKAYEAIEKINFKGMHYRKDIGI
ncbi:MAG: phosphoribosylamine--glycine ligase [Nitrospirota bacterium]